MAIRRKGIVARPGVHYNVMSGKDEVITWEELVEAVQFQRKIPLVLEHPATGHINPNDRIGMVEQRVNEDKEIIEGEFFFFSESQYWNQIPRALKKKITGGQKINLSAGYKVGGIVEGRQRSRQYDHIALDITKPMFQDVGIQKGEVRMESELPDNFRIEETPIIEGEEKKEETPPKVPKTTPHNEAELYMIIGEMRAEIKALKEAKESKPATEEKVEEDRPEAEATPEPPPPKPKMVVPQGSAEEKEGPDEDGVFRIKVE